MGPRKVYGASQETNCPFCGGTATSKNEQGLPVCRKHTQSEINLKCVCGEYLDIKEGKYGTFFICMNCGPVSSKKAFEINELPLRTFEDI